MRSIAHRNVNRAFTHAMEILQTEGVPQTTRGGPVLALPMPFACTYHHPWERVLFNVGRKANPFFHLFESFWMLAGRNNATWLDTYVHDFSARFAQPNGRLHGAYGQRWRTHFGLDQLDSIIEVLSQDFNTRQAVLTMWDPRADLGVLPELKDRPCNTHIYFRVQQPGVHPHLEMTVCNRSNDAVWGMFGANAVHMSVLHEFLAWRTDLVQGNYVQFTNNLHVYENTLDKWSKQDEDPYTTGGASAMPLFGGDAYEFERELQYWVDNPLVNIDWQAELPFKNLLVPMAKAWDCWKTGARQRARQIVKSTVQPLDWRQAALAWMAPKQEE